MVGRVSRDCIRVLGNRVAVVPVLEEPVPCAVKGTRSAGSDDGIYSYSRGRPNERTERLGNKKTPPHTPHQRCVTGNHSIGSRTGTPARRRLGWANTILPRAFHPSLQQTYPTPNPANRPGWRHQTHSRLVGLGCCIGHLSGKKFCEENSPCGRFALDSLITAPIPIACTNARVCWWLLANARETADEMPLSARSFEKL